jgi:nitroimidazol reductase NimA-like FMN-containing flavoprotein (pyridoxamine 5'-phosphate oxidase superfamily)
MSKEEIDAFLQKNLILQVGTPDKKGDPNILPVWFNYDRSRGKTFDTYSQNIQKDSQYTQKGYYLLFHHPYTHV